MTTSDFAEDSMKYWRKVLTGKYAHWCTEWDDLPIDETCSEFQFCSCYPKSEEITKIQEVFSAEQQAYNEKNDPWSQPLTEPSLLNVQDSYETLRIEGMLVSHQIISSLSSFVGKLKKIFATGTRK